MIAPAATPAAAPAHQPLYLTPPLLAPVPGMGPLGAPAPPNRRSAPLRCGGRGRRTGWAGQPDRVPLLPCTSNRGRGGTFFPLFR